MASRGRVSRVVVAALEPGHALADGLLLAVAAAGVLLAVVLGRV
jgi:hypothetical protein